MLWGGRAARAARSPGVCVYARPDRATLRPTPAGDWQLKKNGGQWLLGKACDGFAPLGPSIVTPDEVGDVNKLWLRTTVNGVELQTGNTKELVHGVEKCAWAVASRARGVRLHAGA